MRLVRGVCVLGCVGLGMGPPAWAAGISVTLRNGDVLHGELNRETVEEIHLKHPVLGELVVSRVDVRSFVIGEAPAPQKTPPKPQEPAIAHVPDTGLLGSGWLMDWRRRLEAGVSGAAGQSSSQQAHVGFTADFENQEVRWQHRTRYFRAESNGQETANSVTASLNLDDLLPDSPRFRFAGGQFDRDNFQSWRNRLTVNGGLGYTVAATERYRLLTRGGVGATYIWGGTEGEEIAPELLLGFDMSWKVSGRQSVNLTNAFYPSLKEGGQFRNVTTFDWIIDLDKELGLGLKLGVDNEHESTPEDGDDRNDFKYTSALIWRL